MRSRQARHHRYPSLLAADTCSPGVLLLAEEHLERLWEGAMAIDMDLGLTRAALQQLVYDTVDANGMSSGAWAAAVTHRSRPGL